MHACLAQSQAFEIRVVQESLSRIARPRCRSRWGVDCLDEQGVSQFTRLPNRKATPALYAFDLLWLDEEDLRQHPLLTRKKRLHKLI